jgi:catechol 2,3-dioxygenase-like lactoylglutathione lyase family enzyme
LIHNVSIEVTDVKRSGEFYDALLRPLGWRRHVDSPDAIGYGITKPVFFITAKGLPQPSFGHICFAAVGVAAVKGAWENAIVKGGIDAGEPGAKPRFGVGYYSAFVKDPDGYEIEVTVAPE